MMRVVTARKRAAEFAEAVDGGSATAVRAEQVAFLALVSQLRDLPEPALPAEFSADLRHRLMAAAPEALTTSTPRRDAVVVTFPTSRRRRTATAAAAACIIAGTGVGVAAASQAALPGDALYPLKRGIERVEVATAGSQHGRGRELLDQADTRISEVTDLTVAHPSEPSTPTLMSKALEDFTRQASDGAGSMMTAYREDNGSSSIQELRTFTDESAQRLDALTGSVPATVGDELADAASALSQLDESARELCPDCSALPTLQLSSAMTELRRDVTETISADGPILAPVSPTQQEQRPSPSRQGSSAPATTPTSQTSPTSPTSQTSQTSQTSPTSPTSAAQTQGQPAGQPTLPDVNTAIDPSTPTPTGSQPNPRPSPSVQTPTLPGGVTVGTSAPPVPLPDVDLPDVPLTAVPEVLDGAGDVLDGPGLP